MPAFRTEDGGSPASAGADKEKIDADLKLIADQLNELISDSKKLAKETIPTLVEMYARDVERTRAHILNLVEIMHY